MAISTAKTRPKWQASSRLGRPTQKVSSAPYQAQIHVRAWLRAMFAPYRHLSRAKGSKNCFLCVQTPQWRTLVHCLQCKAITWKVSNAPYHTGMWEHNSGPFWPISRAAGVQKWIFVFPRTPGKCPTRYIAPNYRVGYDLRTFSPFQGKERGE